MKRRVWVTGASGVLGWRLCAQLKQAEFDVVGTTHHNLAKMDGVEFCVLPLEERGSLLDFIDTRRFDAVIHCGAMTNPDECERKPNLARSVNIEATQTLLDHISPETVFLYVSTDLVFDGRRGNYKEEDEAKPINLYGRTKLEAETRVLRRSGATVIRLAKIYAGGSPFHSCFVIWLKERFEKGKPLPLFEDQFRTPIFVGDAARAFSRVIELGPKARLYHLGGPRRLSRTEFGLAFAQVFNYDQGLIVPTRLEDIDLVPRGNDCSLDSSLFYSDYDFTPVELSAGLRILKQEIGPER
jgi:dTDP-4-dehydrorhamnose reductase